MYRAYCSDCGHTIETSDAFEVIHTHKWKLELQRNRRGKIMATIWHCRDCKGKNKRPSQAPQV